jgi:alkylhydroperoxidase family enzyme
MARLPYIEKSQLAPEHQDLMKREIALYKQLAHSPGALRAQQALGYYIRWKSPLDPRLRELAILQVGWLAQSPYEWSHHVKIGYDFGVTDDDIRGLIAESEGRESGLEPLAKLVCKAAREMTTDGQMAKATFDALRQHVPNEHLVDLIVTIGFYNAVVRVLASLEIDVEPEYRPYLDKHPLKAPRY